MPQPLSAMVTVLVPPYLRMSTRTVTGWLASSGLSSPLLTYSTTILGTLPNSLAVFSMSRATLDVTIKGLGTVVLQTQQLGLVGGAEPLVQLIGDMTELGVVTDEVDHALAVDP